MGSTKFNWKWRKYLDGKRNRFKPFAEYHWKYTTRKCNSELKLITLNLQAVHALNKA